MAISFGFMKERPESLRVKLGRKAFFTFEGKVTLAFLKSYTGLSVSKMMDVLNGNIHYQIFYSIRIRPDYPMTNYKLIYNILLELSKNLHILVISKKQESSLKRADYIENIAWSGK